ncbi:MAG: PQQ-binding-like beta-propeller repeat protein [Phycisphaerales bacterium]|nr:PQQ-binding-like beta-propeller repeat protein [Phycisphaerales bacterium]
MISSGSNNTVPRVDAAIVTWQTNESNDDKEIVVYENSVAEIITDNDFDDMTPDVGSNSLVWLTPTAIQLRRDSGTISISPQGGCPELPRVKGDHIVWEVGCSSSFNEIMYWHDGTFTQITNNGYSDVRPETDGKTVVWYAESAVNQSAEIWKWRQGSEPTAVTSNLVWDVQPDVSGDAIVYSRDDGNDYEIILNVFGLEFQITDNGVNDLEPAIDGNRIVWQSGGNIRYAVISGLDTIVPVGACCVGSACSVISEADCALSNGQYLGDGVPCEVDACGAGPSENWPMFQHDAQRTGRTDTVVPNPPHRVWSVRKGSDAGSTEPIDSPIIGANNSILVPDDGPSNLAFDGNHKLLWRKTNHFVRDPGLARSDGNFFVISNDKLRKVDGLTGSDLCTFSANQSVNAVMDQEGNVYTYTSTADRVFKIAPDCSEVWFASIGDTVRSPIALGTNGSVYVNTDFSIINLDGTTGSELWTIPTPQKSRSPVIGPDDSVYFTVEPNHVWAYDADGNELWTHTFANPDLEVAEQNTSLPAIGSDGTLYVPVTHDNPNRRALIAIDTNGAELWTHVESEPNAKNVAPVIDGSGAIIFAANDELVAFETDGSERWRIPAGGTLEAAPAIGDDGAIYIVTLAGDLIIFDDGCPEDVFPSPQFEFNSVMFVGQDIDNLTVSSIKGFELGDDGMVTVLAGVSGSPDDAVFIQEAHTSGFAHFTAGDSLDGKMLDRVWLPRRDSVGNFVLPAQVGANRAMFLNGELLVSDLADAPIQVDDFWSPSFVDLNNNHEFVIFARRLGDQDYGFHKVNWLTQSLSPLIVDPGWEDFVPTRENGFGDDGRFIYAWADGLGFEIHDQTGRLFGNGDTIDGIPLHTVRNPSLTDDNSIVFRNTVSGGTGAVSIASNGVATSLFSLNDSISDIPTIEIDVLEVNPATGDFGSINRMLAGREGLFMAGEIVALENKTLIGGERVQSIDTSEFSTNRKGQVAFVATVENIGTALYVATPTQDLDSNFDGFVYLDDYAEFADCLDGPGEFAEPSCQIFDADNDCQIELEDAQALQLAFAVADCNDNDIPDLFEPDCNDNRQPDDCDIAAGDSLDLNENGIPDECEADCNYNDVPDDWDILLGTSLDCLANGVPDECESISDCNSNGVLDNCDISYGSSLDCNNNGNPDDCELQNNDCNANTVPDDCEESALITMQPLAQDVCIDEPVIFTVLAPDANTFQWKLDDNDVIDGDGIFGANTDTLSISNVQEFDAGVYTCEVSKGCIVVTTSPTTLGLLNTDASITSQPVPSIAACTGQTRLISVGTTGDELTFEWRKDGIALSDGGNISGVNTNQLMITNLSLADEANSPGYTCLVSDGGCFSEESNASTLQVVGPTFSAQPQDVVVDAGQPAAFTVGVSPPSGFSMFVQWHKNGSPLFNGGNISGVFTDTLSIGSTSLADEGSYSLRVLVIGANCVEFSNSAQLTVND